MSTFSGDPASPVPTYPSGGTTSTIQDAIRRDIITGRLAPGVRLTEVTLARQHAVSRVPVREALHGLESEGFVLSRPNAGCWIAEIPVADADDLFAMRETLETATVRRAAERASQLWSGRERPEEWWRIRRRIAEYLDAGDDHVRREDLAPLVEINDVIHLGIAELGGSGTLTLLLRQLSWKIEWLYAAQELPRGKRLWGDHRRIMAAIDAGDVDRAVAEMRTHVRESWIGYLGRYVTGSQSSDPAIAAEVRRRSEA